MSPPFLSPLVQTLGILLLASLKGFFKAESHFGAKLIYGRTTEVAPLAM